MAANYANRRNDGRLRKSREAKESARVSAVVAHIPHFRGGASDKPKPRPNIGRKNLEIYGGASATPIEIHSEQKALTVLSRPAYGIGQSVYLTGQLTWVIERKQIAGVWLYCVAAIPEAWCIESNLRSMAAPLPFDDLSPAAGWIPPGFYPQIETETTLQAAA